MKSQILRELDFKRGWMHADNGDFETVFTILEGQSMVAMSTSAGDKISWPLGVNERESASNGAFVWDEQWQRNEDCWWVRLHESAAVFSLNNSEEKELAGPALQHGGKFSWGSETGTSQHLDWIFFEEQQQGRLEAGIADVPMNTMQTVNAIADLSFKIRLSSFANTVWNLSRNTPMSIVNYRINKVLQ